MDMQAGFWGRVELMGHQLIVGYITEQEVAGAKMLRVDVPKLADQQAITKLYGSAAIYAITPLEEDTARVMASKVDTAPVTAWDARLIAKQLPSLSHSIWSDDEVLGEEDSDENQL